MAKSMDSKKELKKKPAKSIKEKRQEKKDKKKEKQDDFAGNETKGLQQITSCNPFVFKSLVRPAGFEEATFEFSKLLKILSVYCE